MDFYCTADKLKITIYRCLLLLGGREKGGQWVKGKKTRKPANTLQVYLLPFQWLRFMHQIRALKPLVNRSHVTNSMYTQIQKNLIRQSLKAYIVKRKEEITTAQVITQLNQVHTLIWSDHTYSVLEVLIYLRRIFVF